ncbi:MAG: leucine-rich repeat protein [Oscillospiraceae bacterium]|nr:leucine-rich repeat protein [Oscillospiraceae bacterium]
MNKRIGNRLLSFFVVGCLCVSLLPGAALAADTEETVDPDSYISDISADDADAVGEPADDAEPVTGEEVYTAAVSYATSGTCGDNLTWTLEDDVLTISGEGEMEDYDPFAPWYWQCSSITTVVIEDGITSIGNYAFFGFSSLESVTIPDSVTSIGFEAFYYCSNLTSVTIGRGVTYIGHHAFSLCNNLNFAYYRGSETEWRKVGGYNTYYNKELTNVLHCAVGDITVAKYDADTERYTEDFDTLETGDLCTFSTEVIVEQGSPLSFDKSNWVCLDADGKESDAVVFDTVTVRGAYPMEENENYNIYYVSVTASLKKDCNYTIVFNATDDISSDVGVSIENTSVGIIVIPGICGSELIANEDIIGYSIAEGDTVWVPSNQLRLADEAYANVLGFSKSPILSTYVSNYDIKAKSVSVTDENIGAQDTYTNLVNHLYEQYDTENGGNYDVQFFSYDWRYSITDGAEVLEEFIAEQGYESVILVCHSMGGLVATQYISNTGGDKVEKLITVATPYLGAPKALYVLGTGYFLSNAWLSSTKSDLVSVVKATLTKSFFKTMAQMLPTVYELLPNATYLSANSVMYQKNNILSPAGNHYTTAELEDYICTNFSELLYADASAVTSELSPYNVLAKVDAYVIVGTGYNTVTRVGVNASTNKMYDIAITGNGDGTVPYYSATLGGKSATGLYGNAIRTVSADHTSIVKDNKTTFSYIDDAINDTWLTYSSRTSASASTDGELTELSKICIEGGKAYTVRNMNGNVLLTVTDDQNITIADGYEYDFYFLGSGENETDSLGTLVCFLDADTYQVTVSESSEEGFICTVTTYSDYSNDAVIETTAYTMNEIEDGSEALITTGKDVIYLDSDGDGVYELELTVDGDLNSSDGPNTITPGDLNGDGEVNASDLTILARHVGKVETIEDSTYLANADVTGDGEVDASDLTRLAQYVGRIISSLD